MKLRFRSLPRLAALFGTCLAVVVCARATDVQMRVTYTGGSVQIYGLDVDGFFPTADHDTKVFQMGVNSDVLLDVRAINAQNVRLAFTGPPSLTFKIEGALRTGITLPGTAQGVESYVIRVMLTRHGPNGPGNSLPLGEAMPIETDMTEPAPYIAFNIGSTLTGEALPELKIPLFYRYANSSEIVPPDSPDVIYTSDAGGFTLTAPQVKAVLALDPANAGNFSLTFSPPQDNASAFVTYYFGFDPFPTNPGNVVLKKATVTKTPATGGRTYETTFAYGDGPRNAGQFSWTIEEWHTGTTVLSKRIGTVTRPYAFSGITPEEVWVHNSTEIEAVNTVDVATNAVVAQLKREYWNYFFQTPGNIYSPRYDTEFFLKKITRGESDGNYVTEFLNDPGSPGIEGTIQPGGQTEIAFDGDNAGAYRYRYRSWLDQSPTFTPGVTSPINANGGVVTTTALETDSRWVDFAWPKDIQQIVGTRVLTKATVSYSEAVVDDRGTPDDTKDDLVVVTATRSDYAAVGGEHIDTIAKKYRPDAPDPALRGQLYAVESPTGAKQSYAYERGSYVAGTGAFTPDATGLDLRMTVLSGTTSGGNTVSGLSSTVKVDPVHLFADRSTKDVVILKRGRLARREMWIYKSGADTSPVFSTAPVTWATYGYTVDGRLQSRSSSNGGTFTATWSGTRKTSEIDEAGLVTLIDENTGYDAMDRIVALTRDPGSANAGVPLQRTAFTYDAANRIRFQAVGPETGEHAVGETQYDLGGRVKKTIAPEGTTTDYAYPGNGRDVTVTYCKDLPEQAMKSTAFFIDGRIQSVTGTAVAVPRYYTYGFDSAGRPTASTRSGSASGPLQITAFDLLGRLAETRGDGFAPAVGSAKSIVTTRGYNPQGLLKSITTVEEGGAGALAADSLFEYDEFGVVKTSGLDLDGVAGLQADATDRLTTRSLAFSSDGNFAVETRGLYHTDYATGSHTATSKTRIASFAPNVFTETFSTDFFGNTVSQTIGVDRNTRTRIVTTIGTDGTKTVATSVAGLVTREEVFADSTSGGSQAVTHTYDALGRRRTSTDARGVMTRMEYYPGTYQLHETYSGQNETGSDVLVSRLTYDHAGRVSSAESAKTNAVTTTTYYSTGQVKDVGGTGAHPLHYVYNEFGQQTELWTYRDGSTPDKTVWVYDANTGWLKAKQYGVDATGSATQTIGYDYSYASPYKLVTRTSPRSSVTTTYKYRLDTGELEKIHYGDGMTPDVTYGYTRTGQLKTVDDATGHRVFTYDREQLASEQLDSTWYGGLLLTTQFDNTATQNPASNLVPGRYAGFKLGLAGAPEREMKVSFGYDDFGRISSLTADYAAQSTRAAVTSSVSYDYTPNTFFWEKLTNGNFIFRRVLEDHRDVIKTVTAKIGATTIAQYDYKTNDAGERTSVLQQGKAFGDGPTDGYGDATFFKYGYNSTGELTNASGYIGSDVAAQNPVTLPGRNYSYDYDTAGNRTTAGLGGETSAYRSGIAVTDSAGANNLNQVLSRDTLKTRFSGTSLPQAVVKVDGVIATRNTGAGERYWDTAIDRVDQYKSIDAVASLNGQLQVVTKPTTFRPQRETFTYDAEGNLTDDSLWHYDWDAENRLVHMRTSDLARAWLAPDAAPNRDISFVYDYAGRRVEKVVKLDGIVTESRRYVYDGWNLIAEYELVGGVAKIKRSYVWGLDVTGTLTGAAGVGGLVLETAHTDAALAIWNVASDANGNVTTLTTAAGGIDATYEYDPFGQLQRATGPEKDNNPFHFSTKFQDKETGLLYYGRRYYDATLGRFINRDPAEESGGENLYAFVGNSPTNRWDYAGMGDESPLLDKLFNRANVMWQWIFSSNNTEDLQETSTQGVEPYEKRKGPSVPAERRTPIPNENEKVLAGSTANAGPLLDEVLNGPQTTYGQAAIDFGGGYAIGGTQETMGAIRGINDVLSIPLGRDIGEHVINASEGALQALNNQVIRAIGADITSPAGRVGTGTGRINAVVASMEGGGGAELGEATTLVSKTVAEGRKLLTKAEEILSRLGTSRESAARLARKAAEAEEKIGIHGISTSAAAPTSEASSAARSVVENHFPVHNTPTRADPLHRTVEIPKPVTQEIADTFNRILGRK